MNDILGSAISGNPLIEAMTDDQLVAIRDSNKDSEAVQSLVNGILEARDKERKDKELEDTFLKELSKIELPPPPSKVVNIYRAWRKVFRPITKAEVKDYLKNHPEANEADVKARLIETDTWAWGDWELNKGFNPSGTSKQGTSAKAGTSPKRAILVRKVEGDKVVSVGNFRNGNEACQYLKLATGGDSAIRVLQRFGYITEGYNGTDFTVKTS